MVTRYEGIPNHFQVMSSISIHCVTAVLKTRCYRDIISKFEALFYHGYKLNGIDFCPV